MILSDHMGETEAQTGLGDTQIFQLDSGESTVWRDTGMDWYGPAPHQSRENPSCQFKRDGTRQGD